MFGSRVYPSVTRAITKSRATVSIETCPNSQPLLQSLMRGLSTGKIGRDGFENIKRGQVHDSNGGVIDYTIDEGINLSELEIQEILQSDHEEMVTPLTNFSDDSSNTLVNDLREHYIKPNRVLKELSDSLLDKVFSILEDGKCRALFTVDVSNRHPSCHYFIFATCYSVKHMKAIAADIKYIKKEHNLKKTSFTADGLGSNWTVVELCGIQVHLMDADIRQELELEKLWTLGHYDDQMQELERDPVKIVKRGSKRLRVKYI